MIPAVLPGGVVVRAYRLDDAPALAAAIERSRSHLRRWLPWAATTTTVDDSAAFLAQAVDVEDRGTGLHCGLFDGG